MPKSPFSYYRLGDHPFGDSPEVSRLKDELKLARATAERATVERDALMQKLVDQVTVAPPQPPIVAMDTGPMTCKPGSIYRAYEVAERVKKAHATRDEAIAKYGDLVSRYDQAVNKLIKANDGAKDWEDRSNYWKRRHDGKVEHISEMARKAEQLLAQEGQEKDTWKADFKQMRVQRDQAADRALRFGTLAKEMFRQWTSPMSVTEADYKSIVIQIREIDKWD